MRGDHRAQVLVAGSDGHAVLLVDPTNGRIQRRLAETGVSTLAIAFRPDGRSRAVSCFDQTV